MKPRTYLDWNATAPLRPEARAAMLRAMDEVGNPSSVHAEGRRARGIVERARAQVAQAFGAASADIVFTSGATEAAALALQGRGIVSAAVEHPCVAAWTDNDLGTGSDGTVAVDDPARSALQLANSETGVVQDLPEGLAVSDCVQAFGKIPVAFDWLGVDAALLSAHKIGGPKGVGALVLKQGVDLPAQLLGGGQELGRRAGTENVIGIAGFGAAAEAAARDLDAGLWDTVAERRDRLEDRLAEAHPDLIFAARTGRRLPNTTTFAAPGWKGETQVMAMDLAGFAVSAGSACSSGKVRQSAVWGAMGFDGDVAQSTLRVSIGPDTKDEELEAFAATWAKAYAKHRARAA